MGPPYGKRDPYYSHIFRDSYGSGMGIVWEAYHKGVRKTEPRFAVPVWEVGFDLRPEHLAVHPACVCVSSLASLLLLVFS